MVDAVGSEIFFGENFSDVGYHQAIATEINMPVAKALFFGPTGNPAIKTARVVKLMIFGILSGKTKGKLKIGMLLIEIKPIVFPK